MIMEYVFLLNINIPLKLKIKMKIYLKNPMLIDTATEDIYGRKNEMSIHDNLGSRMKEYESRNQYYLQKRTPVAIRVDMRAGHTFTRGFARPFDEVFGNAMVRTMEYCAKNIGNCVFAYCQSDEITFILVDYAKLETDAWFDYRTDKLCSISASMATMVFNRYFLDEYKKWCFDHLDFPYRCNAIDPKDEELDKAYTVALEKGAMFDARAFNVPKEEVTNLIYWRQLDATRNSIQMVGQANFSHSELQGKTCNMIQDMLHEQKDINWNDFPTRWKRGVACRKVEQTVNIAGTIDIISTWELDLEMPILKGEDREYIDKLIYVGD